MSSLFSPAGVDWEPRYKLDAPVDLHPLSDHGIISVRSLPKTPIALGANSPIVTFRLTTLQYSTTVTYCTIVLCAQRASDTIAMAHPDPDPGWKTHKRFTS